MKTRFLRRYLIKHLVATILCGACSSCRSSGYLGDRCRDAGDIVTTTIGKGVGAKVRVGPLHVGAFANRDCAGLRNGSMFSDWKRDDGNFSFTRHPVELDLTVFFIEGTGPGFNQVRGKTYEAGSMIPFVALVDKRPLYMHWYYYTQMEAALGLGGTIRIGVNAGELLDFLFGWFGADIMHDDINRADALPQGFALGGQVASPSGWYVWNLVGVYADHTEEWLSAIIQPPISSTDGVTFEGMNVRSEMTVSIVCTSNGNSVWGADGHQVKNTTIMQPGFHVYERRTNDLIRSEIDVSRDEFREFMRANLPEHSLVALKLFVETRAKEKTSNHSSEATPKPGAPQ